MPDLPGTHTKAISTALTTAALATISATTLGEVTQGPGYCLAACTAADGKKRSATGRDAAEARSNLLDLLGIPSGNR